MLMNSNKTIKILNSISNIPQVDNNDLSKVNFESRPIKKRISNTKLAFSTIGVLLVCIAIILPIVLTQGIPHNYVEAPSYYNESSLTLRAIDKIENKKILLPNQDFSTFALYNYEDAHIGYKFISNKSINNYENIEIVITKAAHIIEDDNYKVLFEKTRFSCVKVYYNEIPAENGYVYYISFFKNDHNYRVSFESSTQTNVKKALRQIF